MRTSRVVALVLLCSAGGLGLAACGGDDSSSSGDDVSGVVWQLTELEGEPVPEGVTPTLEYDGTRISGSSGCNTYGGEASFDDGAVTIAPELMSTLMACEPPASDVEAAFLTVLPTVTGFEVDGDTLSLSVDDDETLIFSSSS